MEKQNLRSSYAKYDGLCPDFRIVALMPICSCLKKETSPTGEERLIKTTDWGTIHLAKGTPGFITVADLIEVEIGVRPDPSNRFWN
ncbi:hypothetical protein VNO77_26857 [Canavalia gladiata]|uniref:Uncharacterized protein n=1 Tax=Canavalia gladiata TaxID=3824 RepID=A0AAN9KT04_CANGL